MAAIIFLSAMGIWQQVPDAWRGEPQLTQSGPSARDQSDISAEGDALAVLARAREAHGGTAALAGVRTLLIRGSRTDGQAVRDVLTYRILFPSSFQERSETPYAGLLTFTIAGPDFRVDPPNRTADLNSARRSRLRAFVELCLEMVLRSPNEVSIKATSIASADNRVATLSLTGDVTRTLAFDRTTGRIAWMEHAATLDSGTRSPNAQVVTRRVVYENFRQISGIWFPVSMTELYSGSPRFTVEFSEIHVNEGVSPGDFRK
jgi:hypothetical protein